MSIGLNQRDYLCREAMKVLTLDFDRLWKATENMEEPEYKRLLATSYNDEDKFKQLIQELYAKR